MREWIVTNGLGSYASLTHSNDNTRKFHGLLVASLNPPTERWVFVSNIYDKILAEDRFYSLNDFKCRFTFDMFPSFSYDVEGVKIKKTIFMPHERNTTIVKYEFKTNKPISMFHNPVINSRHFYDVTTQGSVSFKQDVFEQGVCVSPSNINKKLKIILCSSEYEPSEYWKESRYEKDSERNDSFMDHNLLIGNFCKKINESCEYYLIFTLEDEFDSNPSTVYSREIQRKKDLLEQANLSSKFEKI